MANCEDHKKVAVRIGLAQKEEPGFSRCVSLIWPSEQGLVEEDLLAFCDGDAVSLPILEEVPLVPVEARSGHRSVKDIDGHQYIIQIYKMLQ